MLGAGLALLFAPKPGDETRREVAERAQRVRDKAREGFGTASERVTQFAERGKAMVQTAAEKAREAAQAVREGRDPSAVAAGCRPTRRSADAGVIRGRRRPLRPPCPCREPPSRLRCQPDPGRTDAVVVPADLAGGRLAPAGHRPGVVAGVRPLPQQRQPHVRVVDLVLRAAVAVPAVPAAVLDPRQRRRPTSPRASRCSTSSCGTSRGSSTSSRRRSTPSASSASSSGLFASAADDVVGARRLRRHHHGGQLRVARRAAAELLQAQARGVPDAGGLRRADAGGAGPDQRGVDRRGALVLRASWPARRRSTGCTDSGRGGRARCCSSW